MNEPEIDEARFADTQRTVKVSALRGAPFEDDRCGSCYYYLEPDAQLAFCWHEKLQMLVGENWWCHYWEQADQ
jgi:hypothetical protein